MSKSDLFYGEIQDIVDSECLSQIASTAICYCMILHSKFHYGYCNVTPFCVLTSFSEEVSRSPICIFKAKYLFSVCSYIMNSYYCYDTLFCQLVPVQGKLEISKLARYARWGHHQ